MGFFDSDHHDDERGVDDWLMSYADMITLIVCFFAMFLSISVPKQQSMEEARENVAEVFAKKQAHQEDTAPAFDTEESPHTVAGDNAGAVKKALLDKMPSIIDNYRDSGQVDVQQDGDRITIIEMDSALFFGSGSADLSPQGKQMLAAVGESIHSGQFEGYNVTVEGHTDDAPINTPQFPSNWELSAARSAAVVRYFIELGVPPTQLRATGYADTQPKVTNRDFSGNPLPANQAQNRRVVIRLEKLDKQSF